MVDDIHFTSPISFIGHSITQTLHGTASPDCLQNGQGWWFGGRAAVRQSHGVYGLPFALPGPAGVMFRLRSVVVVGGRDVVPVRTESLGSPGTKQTC